MSMKRLLFFILLALVSTSAAKANPNLTQYGASAWCGARQRGASIEKANRQMRSAMSSSMVMGSGDFASQIVGLLNSRDAMQSSINYHIQQMCPGLVYDNNPGKPATTTEATDKSSSSYCTWNPWSESCKDGSLKETQAKSNCLKAIEKYDCRYAKYLEANPHMQDWVNSNPEMARKEALRLKAVDADEIGAEAKQVEISPLQAEKADAEETCLKAADYKGCMEYNKSN